MDAEQLKSQGNAFFSQKKFEEAIKCFSEAIKLDPSNHILYSNRSGAFSSQGKYDKALEDAEICIKLKPDWAKGYSRKGLAEFNAGKLNEAIETYKKGLEIEPGNESLKEGLRQAELFSGDMIKEQSLNPMIENLLRNEKFKKYAEEDPNYIKNLKGMLSDIIRNPSNIQQTMMSLFPDKRYKEAFNFMLGLGTDGEEEDEESKAFRKRREEAEKKKKELEERLKKEKMNLTEEEFEAERMKDKGNKLYQARKFEEAIEAYDKAIELNPRDILFHNNKAAVYLEMGKYDSCLEECQKALDKRYEVRAGFEKVAKVYNRMAACYKKMKDYQRSIECYEKSLTEDNNRHTRTALADVKRIKAKKEEEDYIDPVKAEEHKERGNTFFKENKYPDAKKEYDEAIRRNPKDPKLYANRGATFMKLGELPTALKDVEKSLELDPKVPKVWARKGNIHMLMKEYNKSVSAYQKGLDVDPGSLECRQGLDNVFLKIQENTSSDKVDEEQISHAMADPEIQEILRDPQFRIVLSQMSEDPTKLAGALKDPKISQGIQKLMAAGILKMA